MSGIVRNEYNHKMREKAIVIASSQETICLYAGGESQKENSQEDAMPVVVEIVRTHRRRTVSIEIKQGQVRLLSPEKVSQTRLKELLEKRRRWIQRKLNEHAARPVLPVPFYETGERFLFRGKAYRLQVVPSFSDAVSSHQKAQAPAESSPLPPLIDAFDTSAFSGNSLMPVAPSLPVSQDCEGLLSDRVRCDGTSLLVLCAPSRIGDVRALLVKRSLHQWYQKQAASFFIQRTRALERLMGVCAKSIKVKDYKARWGSCSYHGEITYNWRLIMAPDPIIDYVIIHELCHILEHNHSKAFWRHVERFFPLHKAARLWLKKNGQALDSIGSLGLPT